MCIRIYVYIHTYICTFEYIALALYRACAPWPGPLPLYVILSAIERALYGSGRDRMNTRLKLRSRSRILDASQHFVMGPNCQKN